jgi:hypothetical protein
MLAGLTENIMSLLSFFKRMNVAIEEIINENESAMSSIAEDAASGMELNEHDIEVSILTPIQFTRADSGLVGLPTQYEDNEKASAVGACPLVALRECHHGHYQPWLRAGCPNLSLPGRFCRASRSGEARKDGWLPQGRRAKGHYVLSRSKLAQYTCPSCSLAGKY